ncbi:PE family protein [Mycobacterium decipiens]|uniref:PE family protein n=1 Tax=Mycobacterium decipiens TaxID=1430326 RepID=A0A1X2LXV8_9MYCO|nr:PE-PPE domain-containing protein [Mycobacterium decipiens]OSC42043.1 PE family protein [Mycobacterium decipiens]
MTYVTAQLDMMAAAAADVAGIGSAVSQANAAAAGPTTALVAAAADEVSAATATLFSTFAHEYQAITKQAAVYHEQFTQALAAAGRAYASAEAANAAAASNALSALTAPARALVSPLSVSNALAAPAAATDISLVMHGSGMPIPSPGYVLDVVTKYVTPNFPGFTADHAQALATPEGFYPLTAVKDLTLDVSVARGVTILEDAIRQQLAAGNKVAVVGFSQSAMLSSLVMPNLHAAGIPTTDVNFTLLGNPMNPNGGLVSRFAGLVFPSLGATFYGSTPDNLYPTNVYTIEYDGFASFPQYPIFFLSDLNAMLGVLYAHGEYPNLTPEQIASAVVLPTEGPTQTTYYMIPNENLPILQPVRAIPVVGNIVAALIEPNVEVLVNLGYGDPNYGYSTGPANVPTPFGLLPPVHPQTVLDALVLGTQQGMHDASVEASNVGFPSLPSLALSDGSNGQMLLPNPLTVPGTLALPQWSIDTIIKDLQAANTNINNAFTGAISTGYSVLLPTADIATAGLLTLPSYNVNLFLDGILQAANGDPVGLVNALGYPIAATVGLLTVGIGLEVLVIEKAAAAIVRDLAAIVP